MSYVDGFILAVPKKNLPAYRRMARAAGKVWKKYGAVDFKECVGDDLGGDQKIKGIVPFPRLVRPKRGEVVLFSFIVYKSRKDRDRVNAKVMKDTVILRMMKRPPLFQKMAYGGFKVIVDMR